MIRKIIGLDVDDVVLELVDSWLNKYNLIYNDNLNKKDIKDWNIGSYTKCGEVEFQKLLTSDVYDAIKPVEGALEGVYYLRKKGRVVFVTSNFGDVGRPKMNALNRLGFDVTRKDFIEASDKSLITTHILIDDNYPNVVNAFGTGILFNQEWNKKIDYSPRVRDWSDIIRYADKFL